MPPIYEFSCECGLKRDVYRSIEERNNAPEHCGKPMERVISPTMVMGDIEPYTTVAADKETGKRMHINSRKQHKDFLKRNGYEEIGNEKFTPSPKKEKVKDEGIEFNIFG